MQILLYNHHFLTVISWIAVIAYLLAYLLLSLNILKAGQVLYHLLNLIGAVGLVVHAIYLYDAPNVVVNSIWALIALLAIFLILRKRH